MAPSVKEFKVILIGAAGVGKSSLLRRLRYNRFDSYVESTIGAAFVPLDRRTIQVSTGFQSLVLPSHASLQGRPVGVWDTAGKSR